MRIYQYMLKHCTRASETSDVATRPHRQFFGIADDQFTRWGNEFLLPDSQLRYPYGLIPFSKFLDCDLRAPLPSPGPDEVVLVGAMLHAKGLPMELVLEILDLADYAPRGRLRVPHDPFHRDNADELRKYLKYCWQLLIRCEMMAAELGMEIPWPVLVSRALIKLLSCGPRRWHHCDWGENPVRYTFR